MRRRFHEQLTLSATAIDHRHARELEAVGEILKNHPGILDLVLQDLTAEVRAGEGREGMSAEQVLRAALVKKLHTFTYDELEFHLRDPTTFRGFCGYGPLDGTPSRTTLQRNIKAITEQTWERMNRIVLGFAHERKVEDGRKVRTDGTVTETNIHEPTDSSMLQDCVRVLVRLMGRAAEQHGVSRMPNRLRRAKRRAHDVSATQSSFGPLAAKSRSTRVEVDALIRFRAMCLERLYRLRYLRRGTRPPYSAIRFNRLLWLNLAGCDPYDTS